MDTTLSNSSLSAEQRQYPHRSDSTGSTTSDNPESSLLTNVSKVFNSKHSDGYSTSSSSPDPHHSQAPNDNNRASPSIQRFTSPAPSLTHSFSSQTSGIDSDLGEGSNHATPRTSSFRTSFNARPGVSSGPVPDVYGRMREFLPGRIVLTTPKMNDSLSFDYALIPTPTTYEGLLQVAAEKFHIRRIADITLRCAIKRAGGTTVWADLYSADWAFVIKDGDEIGVFRKDDIPKHYEDSRPLNESYKPLASTSYDSYDACLTSGSLPTLQVTRSADDGKDAESKDPFEKSFISFMLSPSKGVTSIAEVPDTYEKCQSIARDTFFGLNTFISSSSIILKGQVDAPSGGKLWSIIHQTAYPRMVKQRTGRIDIRVSLDEEQTKNQSGVRPCPKDRTQQQKEAAQKDSSVKAPDKAPSIRDSHLKQVPSLQLNPPTQQFNPPPQSYNPPPPSTPSTAPYIPVEARPFLASNNTFPIGGNKNISRSSAPSPHPTTTPLPVNRQAPNPSTRPSYPIPNLSTSRSSSSLSNRSSIGRASPSASSHTLVSPPPSSTSSSYRTASSHTSNRSNRRSLNSSPHSASDSSSRSALSHSDSSTTGTSSSYDDGSETSTASTSVTKRSKEYLAPTKASMGKDKEKESLRERDIAKERERERERERQRQREKEKAKEPKKKPRSERSYRDDR